MREFQIQSTVNRCGPSCIPIRNLHGSRKSASTLTNPICAQNPYCCSKPDTNGHAFQGTATGNLAMNMTGQDIYLINGGYQPQISMQSDTWQRWRFLYSGAKVRVAAGCQKAQTKHCARPCSWQGGRVLPCACNSAPEPLGRTKPCPLNRSPIGVCTCK
jgi:hypothetical protein